jgi:hypothetical protein
MFALAFIAGWCGNEPRPFPPRGPSDPPWWNWLGISVLAGVAGIGGSILVQNVIGGSLQEPVTVLAGMAGAFLAGRAVAGLARGVLSGRAANLPQIG